MRKSHKAEIEELTLYTPGESLISEIDKYILKEVDRSVKKTNASWGWFSIFMFVVTFFVFQCTKTTRADVLKAAEPIVKDMQIKYQARLDVVCDSLSNEFYKPRLTPKK